MSRRAKRKGLKLKLSKIKILQGSDESNMCQASSTRPSEPVDPIHQVTQTLFLSGYKATKNKQMLQDLRIDHVVNLTSHKCANAFPEEFNYSSFMFSDRVDFDLTAKLNDVLIIVKALTDQGRRVLVHCQMGISRAPSVVMAFLMQFEGASYETALMRVQAANPEAYPNIGFLFQLRQMSTFN